MTSINDLLNQIEEMKAADRALDAKLEEIARPKTNRRTDARELAREIIRESGDSEVNAVAVAEQLDAAGFSDLAFSSIMGAVSAAAKLEGVAIS